MEKRLREVERGIALAESKTQDLERRLRQAESGKRVTEAELSPLRAEIRNLEKKLGALQDELWSVSESNDRQAGQKRDQEVEIQALKTRVAALRAKLLLILSNY